MMVFCRYITAVPTTGNKVSRRQFIKWQYEETGIRIQRVKQNMACWNFASLQLAKDFVDFPEHISWHDQCQDMVLNKQAAKPYHFFHSFAHLLHSGFYKGRHLYRQFWFMLSNHQYSY